MPRVKRGTQHVKRRKNLLKSAKGFKWGRKKKVKEATTAVTKAGAYAYRDRRNKKRTSRSLWIIKMNAALKKHEISYSIFIDKLHKAKIDLDRKVLSELAENHPKVFDAIVKEVK